MNIQLSCPTIEAMKRTAYARSQWEACSHDDSDELRLQYFAELAGLYFHLRRDADRSGVTL